MTTSDGACPGHQALAILSTKWLTLVVEQLEHGRRGHAELRRAVPGASQKMLTQTLRQLERDGMVDRHVTHSVPPRVDYELTELGRSLLPVQRAIRAWGEHRMSEVEAARRGWDDQRRGATHGPADALDLHTGGRPYGPRR